MKWKKLKCIRVILNKNFLCIICFLPWKTNMKLKYHTCVIYKWHIFVFVNSSAHISVYREATWLFSWCDLQSFDFVVQSQWLNIFPDCSRVQTFGVILAWRIFYIPSTFFLSTCVCDSVFQSCIYLWAIWPIVNVFFAETAKLVNGFMKFHMCSFCWIEIECRHVIVSAR